MQYEVDIAGVVRQVSVHRTDERFEVTMDGRTWSIDAVPVERGVLSLVLDDGRAAVCASHEVMTASDPRTGQTSISVGAVVVGASLNNRRRWGRGHDASTASGPQRLQAPMPGKVVRVLVAVGEAVKARQPIVVIEAMKMENELRASADGTIAEIHAREGQSVDAGSLLAVVTPT